MNLTKLEFKKIFTPLTVIAVVVMLLLNLYMTFDYRAYYLLEALDPDSKSKPIETLKSEYAEKRGEITDAWIAARRSDVENILNDPKYLKTEDELEQYLSDLAAQGYPAEEIERLKSQPYTILNNNGITAYEHTEKFTHAASFYDNAEEEKQYLLDEYSSDADICADISARYDALINDYRAFCDYDLAYTSIQYVIANAFPFTVGVPVLIGLAPLFARERARKTDALILSSKRGRRDTARAKICAGTLYTLLVWSVMAISAAAYCFILYGAEGFGAFWQSFTGISSPFRWTIGQAIIVELATSLIGTLFFACIVMLLSELTESMFVSVILGRCAAAYAYVGIHRRRSRNTSADLPHPRRDDLERLYSGKALRLGNAGAVPRSRCRSGSKHRMLHSRRKRVLPPPGRLERPFTKY